MGSLCYDQPSSFIYARFRDKNGKQHTISTKVEKPPKEKGDLTEEEFKDICKDLKSKALRVLKDHEDLACGYTTQDEFVGSQKITAARVARTHNKTPILLFIVMWVWAHCIRNKVGDERAGFICHTVRRFLNTIKQKHKKQLTALKRCDFNDFIYDDRLARYAPGTLNLEVSVLRSLARVVEPHVGANLASELEFEPEEYNKRKPYSIHHITAILRFLRTQGEIGREWRTAILIVLYTNLRPGDACTLRRKDIDLQAGAFARLASKTEEFGSNTMSTVLWEYLKDLIENGQFQPNDYLMPGLAVMPKGSRSRQFRNILEAANVPLLPVKEEYSKRVRNEHCLYALRHTFNTWQRASGKSKEDRKKGMGHKTDQGQIPYEHPEDPLVVEAERKVLDMMPQIPKEILEEKSQARPLNENDVR